MHVFLTDGWDLFDQGEMTEDELAEEQRRAERATAGNVYWTTVDPRKRESK